MALSARYNEIKSRVQKSGLSQRSSRYNELKKKLQSGGLSSEVDEDYINAFLKDSRDFMGRTQAELKGLDFSSATSQEKHDARETASGDLAARAGKIRTYLNANKNNLNKESYEQLTSYLSAFSGFQTESYGAFGKARQYYSQWDTEEDYKKALSDAKEYENKLSFDLDAGQKEIDELEAAKEEYESWKYLTGEEVQAKYRQFASEHGSIGDLESKISEKRAYLTTAKRIQEGVALSGVADPESELYDPEFSQYTSYTGDGVGEGFLDTLKAAFGGEGDDWAYEYINDVDGARDTINGKIALAQAFGSMSDDEVDRIRSFEEMYEDEIAIYNYYYSKDGKEAAGKYLDNIQETLNQRKASAMFEPLEDNALLELAFGVAAGLDQFESGVKNLFNTEDDYIPASATQIASGMVREDLADVGPKLPDWLGGASLGQAGYDTITTTANMAPSILTSIAIGSLSKSAGTAFAAKAFATAGNIAGTSLMGASAAGNAYQEALNLGYDKSQARAYSTLVGASEAGLQYLMGGIGKLGGKLSGGAVTKMLNGVDKAIFRAAGKLVGNMISEGMEEGLQEILTPWFKNLTLNMNEDVNWSEVAYSSLLGALTAGVMEVGGTVSGEVNTYKTGKQLKAAGISAVRLSELGKTFSADTVAYQLAGRVNENTGAYTMGRLFNEIGATLSAQNVTEITDALIAKGMDAATAAKNAEALAYIVEGGQLSERQIAVMEANDVLAEAAITTLIDANTTWNQRTNGYNEMLKALADEMATSKASRTKQAQASEENAPAADTVDSQKENGTQSASEAPTEGQTIRKSDGKAVSIQEITSIKDGRMTFRLADGSEISSTDVEYASSDEALVYETVASMGGSVQSANILVNGFKEARSKGTELAASVYAHGIQEAFRYGKLGIPVRELANSDFASKLTPAQQDYVYRQGKRAAGKQTAKEQAAVAKREKAGDKQGKVYFDKGAKRIADFRSYAKEAGLKLDDIQETAVATMEKLSAALGVDFYVFQSYDKDGKRVYIDENGAEVSAPSGKYYADGKIYIDLYAGNSGKGTMLFTIAHELTHFIRQWSPVKFKVLANFLMKQYGEKNISVSELVYGQIAKAKRNGRDISYDTAYEEVVADSMEAMLTDGNVVQVLTDLKQQDKTLWQKICGWFRDLVEDLRAIVDAYRGYQPDSPEGKMVAQMQDVIVVLESFYADALADAGENYQAEKAEKNTTREGGEAMFSLRGENKDGIEVYETSEEIKKLPYTERQQRFLDIMKNEYRGRTAKFVRNGHAYYATFEESDVNKNIYGDKRSDPKGWKAKINVGADGNIFELVENARYNGSLREKGKKLAAHKGVGYWDYFIKTVQIDDKVFDLVANVRKKADGAYVYSIQLNQNKTIEASPPRGSLLRALSGVPNTSKQNVAQNVDDVKEKFSDRDYAYDALVSKPDMVVTAVDGNVPKNRADVVAAAKKNAASVGRFDTKTGSVSVHVEDIDTDVILGTPGLKHGLEGRRTENAIVTVKAGEILQNSIRINELTPKKEEANGSYVLIGAARSNSGDLYIVRSVVNTFKSELVSMDVLYAINAKKGNRLRSMRPGFQGPVTDSTISIAELLDYVNEYFPDILPEDVLKHYGYDARPGGSIGEDALYSDRDPEAQRVNKVLEKENAKLKDDVSYLKELLKLQKQVTGGTKFTKTSVEAAAGQLMKYAGAKGEKTELVKLLNDFYEYIAKGEELTWEGAAEIAQPAVQWLQSHEYTKKQDAPRDMTPVYEYGYDEALSAQDLLHQVYDSYWNVSTLHTVADVKQKEILKLKGEHAQRMTKLRDYHKEKTAQLKKEHSDNLERVKKEYRKQAKETQQKIILKYQESRKEGIENRNKTAMRQKIRKVIRELDKVFKRGKDQRNVKQEMRDMVSYALASAEVLFTTTYTDNDMIRNGVGVALAEETSRLLNEAKDILEQLDNPPGAIGAEELGSWYAQEQKLRDQLNKRKTQLKDVFISERARLDDTLVTSLMDGLCNAYAELANSDKAYIKAAYDDGVMQHLQNIKKGFGVTRAIDMRLDQLEALYKAYSMVLGSIRAANKAFTMGKSVDQIAKQLVLDLNSRKMPKGKLWAAVWNLSNKIGWNYEKLYYALDRIGSDTLTELFTNLANSENTVMSDVIEAVQERDRIVNKYGYNDWKADQKIGEEFVDNTGKKFRLTLGELMSLYAYSRREGAWKHIEYGGFMFGKTGLAEVDPAATYKLTRKQCEAITDTLTTEQKKFVEEMQTFLSDVMGGKGNEVSMLLYGIELFGEKNYFPIHIAGEYMANAQESQAQAAAGFSSMANAGFTKMQNKQATAPFLMEPFMDVWADHVNEMSRYHGTVPALEDIRRVMNYSHYSESTQNSMSVKAVLENRFGKQAVQYFTDLYREANSGAITDKMQGASRKLLGMFRKNAVAYSMSVLIQQPASVCRAFALLDKKYFSGPLGVGALPIGITKSLFNRWTKVQDRAYAEMLKYAPGVTMAKEIGGFDTASGNSIRSYLLDTRKSFWQRVKTDTLGGKVGAVAGLVGDNNVANLPNVADKIVWVEIWNACKQETAAKHKDLAPGSDEFMKQVGERFTEVIRATQVYDSVFAKSPMLKSKNLAVQYLVSFMCEPNTTANMVESGVRYLANGEVKKGVRMISSVVRSIVFTGVLKSIIYAMRDNDEDETYIEKYTEALVNSLLNDITVFNYIPIARDVWAVAQGYDVERPDMAVISDAITALAKVVSGMGKDTSDMTDEELAAWDKKVTEANWKLVESVAAFCGIPVKNIRREINAVIDHARIAHENFGKTTWKSIGDAVESAIADASPVFAKPETQSDGDKLYDAIVSGDTAYANRLKGGYKDESAYNSAVRKALRENDPRIKEAAAAKYNGNPSEYTRLAKTIIAEGYFSQDNVVAAINAEIDKLREKAKGE